MVNHWLTAARSQPLPCLPGSTAQEHVQLLLIKQCVLVERCQIAPISVLPNFSRSPRPPNRNKDLPCLALLPVNYSACPSDGGSALGSLSHDHQPSPSSSSLSLFPQTHTGYSCGRWEQPWLWCAPGMSRGDSHRCWFPAGSSGAAVSLGRGDAGQGGCSGKGAAVWHWDLGCCHVPSSERWTLTLCNMESPSGKRHSEKFTGNGSMGMFSD